MEGELTPSFYIMSDIKNTSVKVMLDEERELVFTLNVMSDAINKYGRMDNILNDSANNLEVTKWLAVQMVNEGVEIWNDKNPDKKQLYDERKLCRYVQGLGGFGVLQQKVQEAILKGLPEDKVRQVEEIGKNLMAVQNQSEKKK
ncbi:hypothetical protein [Ruminiclostridium cellobioparum]|uniref:Uncharacterized protein n=1 Tax=Ruminiclostridium cellobioparum subsp. termitidis CT1112 TaxID=1195236 RepID=S0FY43_RUMCE|nr:hypothetical protein [Ruminiclostridium cellobioparum]EMS74039.1 hypothetical protein CTER_5105 [Ruminiclostridium cellobioparum subsp. termitidis CT1112]